MSSRVTSQSGFTLAETMVALFILALVSAAGSGLLIGATSSSKQIREAEAEARQLDIAQALIRQDVAAMSLRGVRPDNGLGPVNNLVGEPTRAGHPFLAFVRDGWINPGSVAPRSDLQRVSYRLEDQNLIRSAYTRPDATSGTPVSERVLLTGVQQVQLSFYRGGERSEFWDATAGQPLFILPDMIEFEIFLGEGVTLKIAALAGGRV